MEAISISPLPFFKKKSVGIIILVLSKLIVKGRINEPHGSGFNLRQ